jgi:hypothetical protein
MTKKRASKPATASTRDPGRTSFVPAIVFRALFKTAIPVVSATIVPACLAVRAFERDAGRKDAAPDGVPDASGADALPEGDGKSADAADAPDGKLGAEDASDSGG